MSVSAHIIAEVKRLTHLPEIVGDYVKLRQTGQRWTGLCPFHNEKTGSLSVHIDYWKCFGCSAGGDVYTFLVKIEGISFHVALEQLAQRVGVSLDGRPIPRAVANADREDRAMSRWWWENRRDTVTVALGSAVESGDEELSETVGNILRWIDHMPAPQALVYFKSHVTTEDRLAYHEWVTYEAEFAKTWLSLAGVSV